MIDARHVRDTPRWLLTTAVLAVALFVAAGCARKAQPGEEPDPRYDPIPIHVHNENFLDMNIAVVVGGVSRRLGLVSGNSNGDFTVPWSVGNGSGVQLTATPIGGRGNAVMPALNIGIGQEIDFKIGSVLRQSVATVHSP